MVDQSSSLQDNNRGLSSGPLDPVRLELLKEEKPMQEIWHQDVGTGPVGVQKFGICRVFHTREGLDQPLGPMEDHQAV